MPDANEHHNQAAEDAPFDNEHHQAANVDYQHRIDHQRYDEAPDYVDTLDQADDDEQRGRVEHQHLRTADHNDYTRHHEHIIDAHLIHHNELAARILLVHVRAQHNDNGSPRDNHDERLYYSEHFSGVLDDQHAAHWTSA